MQYTVENPNKMITRKATILKNSYCFRTLCRKSFFPSFGLQRTKPDLADKISGKTFNQNETYKKYEVVYGGICLSFAYLFFKKEQKERF